MNKMGILPIAAALIAFACAPKTGSWPQEVNKYVHRYGDLSKAHNNWSKELREVTIKIVDSVDEDPTTVGVCYSDENYIEIKRSEWDRYDDLTRQALVFHELGHCVHHFEHRGYLSQKTGIQTSIMYPYLLASWEYSYAYDDYNSELFTQKPDKTLTGKPGEKIACKHGRN